MPSLVDFVKKKVKRRLRKKTAPVDSEDEDTLPDMPAAPPSGILDENLEAKEAPDRPAPLNPAVGGVMRKSGLLSMIRNRGNQQMVDPEDPSL